MALFGATSDLHHSSTVCSLPLAGSYPLPFSHASRERAKYFSDKKPVLIRVTFLFSAVMKPTRGSLILLRSAKGIKSTGAAVGRSGEKYLFHEKGIIQGFWLLVNSGI